MSFETIVILIVAVPLLAALANGAHLLAGETLWGWRTTQRITCGAALVSFIGSIWVFAQIIANPAPREVIAYEWIVSGDLVVNLAFLIDSLSAVMMLLVTGFSFIIAMFSRNYLHRDFSFTRYFTVLALFVFAMLVLVMANNFVVLFLGWESAGLCSYLLIGHYYDRVAAARAGTQAFVMNRIGDAGFLMGIFLIFQNFGSVEYATVFANAANLDRATANAICLCLLLGAIGKSAQFPLGTWLAKAMEGPTPSSALSYAATMVTAGVYLLARAHSLYDQAPEAMAVVTIVGALTAVYGATVGLALTDIKGILAVSSTTQLGLMFVACGLGAYPVAIFHLVAHALFKTYLFLTAPSILHHFHVFPDPNAADAKNSPIPVAYWIVLAGTVGIAAYPFAMAWSERHDSGGLAASYYVLMAAGAMALFVALYFVLTILHRIFSHGHGEKTSAPFVVSGIGLALGIATGVWLGILPGGMPGTWFADYLAPIVTLSPTVASESVLSYAVVAALGLLLLCAWTTANYMDRFKPEVPGTVLLKARGFYNLALHRFYLDEYYRKYLVGTTLRLGKRLDRFDTDIIDRIVGAPLPADRIRSAEKTWESYYLAARTSAVAGTVPAHTDGMLNWLTRVSAIRPGLEENEVAARNSNTDGDGLAALAPHTSPAFEKDNMSGATGVIGTLTDAAASVSGGVERNVFDLGVTNGISQLTDAAALVSSWVERNVFELGVADGVPHSSGVVGRTFNKIEDVIARPIVSSIILAVAILTSL
ncbi:MAG: NADH-quinone oxidoreductase subunit L [Gammaproteobacteria bacterium]|jgi:NADH-quinone oxidoreductase subunit L